MYDGVNYHVLEDSGPGVVDEHGVVAVSTTNCGDQRRRSAGS